MAENSGISWTDNTFNPWVGCTKVGPGCDHCYAEAWNARFGSGVAPNWGAGAPRRRTAPQNWSKVHKWQREAATTGKRLKVFCASLADVFDNEVDPAWRADLWTLYADCPDLDWIFVTKRVGNVTKMVPAAGFGANAIVLATIVNQYEADRDMGKLVKLKADGITQMIGVSYEPALGPVNWSPWVGDLDWLIVGGESDQGSARARRFDPLWAMDAIRVSGFGGPAAFVKQLGSNCGLNLRDKAGAAPAEWPDHLRVQQFPWPHYAARPTVAGLGAMGVV